MSALPRPHVMIFDWDNTLVDTWPVIHAALVSTMEAMNVTPWTLAETQERVSRSMRDAFPKLFGARWEEAGKLYQDHYRARHLDNLLPLAEAEALLMAVQAADIISVVVSNKKGNTLRQEIAHLGWTPYFQAIVGSDDAARDKPHPDPVHMALEKIRRPGPDVWFVGDSDVDLECAAATGCTPVLFGELAASHAEYSAERYLGFVYAAHARTHQDMLTLLKAALARG